MRKIVILIAVICGGCGFNDLTREQTVTACKECTDEGFDAEILYNGLNFLVRDVRCAPMRGEKPAIRNAEIK